MAVNHQGRAIDRLLVYACFEYFAPIWYAHVDFGGQTAATHHGRVDLLADRVTDVVPEPKKFPGNWNALKPGHTGPCEPGPSPCSR